MFQPQSSQSTHRDELTTGNSEEPNASGPVRCRRSSGEGEAVHSLRVLGIALVGAAQIVESSQAALLLAEDGAQVLEGHGIPGIGGKSLHGVLFGLREVARPLVAERQGYAVRGASSRQRCRSSRPLSSWLEARSWWARERWSVIADVDERAILLVLS